MKNFIRSVYTAICNSRLEKAQHDIAHQLWRSEYRYESFDYVLNAVKTGKIFEMARNAK